MPFLLPAAMRRGVVRHGPIIGRRKRRQNEKDDGADSVSIHMSGLPVFSRRLFAQRANAMTDRQ
jgi:hypothetical protein